MVPSLVIVCCDWDDQMGLCKVHPFVAADFIGQTCTCGLTDRPRLSSSTAMQRGIVCLNSWSRLDLATSLEFLADSNIATDGLYYNSHGCCRSPFLGPPA